MSALTVTVEHLWTRETQDVPVESVERESIVLRWGMSGLYDLDLRANTIRARSAGARRKGPCLWQAKDIEKVRAVWREKFKQKEDDECKARMEKHAASMPGLRKSGA